MNKLVIKGTKKLLDLLRTKIRLAEEAETTCTLGRVSTTVSFFLDFAFNPDYFS